MMVFRSFPGGIQDTDVCSCFLHHSALFSLAVCPISEALNKMVVSLGLPAFEPLPLPVVQ